MNKKLFLFTGLVAQIVVFGFVDYYSGYEVRLGALYALPVAYAAWFFGRAISGLSALICVLVMLCAEICAGKVYSSDWFAIANTASRLAIFVFVSVSVAHFRRTVDIANKRMKAFQGSLHVCCGCHRIDGGGGFWVDFPTYIRENSQAKLQFETCPICTRAQENTRQR